MLLELPVIRVQVQLDRIKVGLPPRRRYEPVILREVAELHVTADGAVGVAADGTEYLDVHNGHHPHTRDAKRRNGISIMTTGDYAALRQRYGPHLVTGVAGESVLVAVDGPWPVGDLLLETDDQPLLLTDVVAAPPCVEFSRFCLGIEPGPVGDDVKQALLDLDGGARGYYARVTGEGRVVLGARISAR
jgi:hypothetical protein